MFDIVYEKKARYGGEDEEEEDDEDEDENDRLENMCNIRVIRDYKCYINRLIGKEFVGEKQYRLLLDNHMVLLYFLDKFRYPLKIDNMFYRVKLLEPILNRNMRFEGSNFDYYLEKQLISSENPYFYNSIRFDIDDCIRIKEGLLSSAVIDKPFNFVSNEEEDENKKKDALDMMIASSSLSSKGKYIHKLTYNTYNFLIDSLTTRKFILVNYSDKNACISDRIKPVIVSSGITDKSMNDDKNKRPRQQAQITSFFKFTDNEGNERKRCKNVM
jgi:hypothetical protein